MPVIEKSVAVAVKVIETASREAVSLFSPGTRPRRQAPTRAIPSASVIGAPPVTVPPPLAMVNATENPTITLPNASVTLTVGWVGTALPMVAACSSPSMTVICAAGPTVAVAWNVERLGEALHRGRKRILADGRPHGPLPHGRHSLRIGERLGAGHASAPAGHRECDPHADHGIAGPIRDPHRGCDGNRRAGGGRLTVTGAEIAATVAAPEVTAMDREMTAERPEALKRRVRGPVGPHE